MPKTKKFAFPPLEEVAFEINFLPKLKVFDNLSDFQEEISNNYPNISEEQLFPLQQPGQPPEYVDRLKKRLIFENLKKTRMVRISLISFNFVERSYDSFAQLSKEIKALWKIFSEKIGKVSINRIGLRYINKLRIPIEKDDSDIINFIKPYYDSGRFNGYNIRTITIEARTFKKDINISIRSGIIGNEIKNGNKSIIYLLDYDCNQMGANLSGNPTNRINKYHSLIEKKFLSDIEDKYKYYMENGRWK